MYAILLAIGAVGLLAQALLGLAHSGGHHGGDHGGGHGHAGHGHGHGHGGHGGHGHGGDHAASNGHVGPATHTGANHAAHVAGHHGPNWAALLGILSPLTIFAVALGAGAVGLALRLILREPLLALTSAVGGLAFNALLVRPLFRAVLDFGSTPAAALEGAVMASAEAVSRFDEHGRGVVRVTIDGQTVRLLARLDAHDLGEAPGIAPGDTLTITEVDPARNACRVARL